MADERPLSAAERQQMMDMAWKLQGEKEVRDRGAADLEARVRAGTELGLDPSLLQDAEAMVRMQSEGRRLQAAARRQRNLGILAGVALLLSGMGLVVGGGILLAPGPVTPIEAPFSAADWQLELSPGTTGTVTYAGDVASLRVDRFTAMPDGRFWANLESSAHPSWAGLETVSFSVRGEGLANVRLYLENPTERWRGPVVPVTGEWQRHQLKLSAFERQKMDTDWRVVADDAPTAIKTVSVKLGAYVNDVSSRGVIELKELRGD